MATGRSVTETSLRDEDWPAVPAAGPSELPPPDVLDRDVEKGLRGGEGQDDDEGKDPEGEADVELARTATARSSVTDVSAAPAEQAHAAEHKGDIYDRFSKTRKYMIVGMVSYSALLAPFASSSFLPSIPVMANDLNTSGSVINYTVAIYLVTIGVAPLAWAPYARFYGRKWVYVASLPLFCIGSMGVALSNSLVSLIVTRILQGIGSSSVLSVGAGSIGDIYRPTERGRAMGLYYGGALFGPALAPVVAGALTEYVPNGYGWRAMQWLLCAMGVLAFSLMLLFLPETAHVRGITAEKEKRRAAGKSARIIVAWLDPIQPVWLLKYKNIACISITSSVVLLTTYTIIVPLTYTIGPRYNITNVAILGVFYLAPGIGNMFGSRIGGIIADRVVKASLRKRNGLFRPEDRLKSCLMSAGLILPLSVLFYGIVIQFWTGVGGLVVALIMIILSGFGMMMVLSVCNTYLVDSMQNRSTEVIAINNCLRYIASAAASAYCLPLTGAIGVAGTNAMSAGLTWIGFGLLIWTIRSGDKWREKHDGKTPIPSGVAAPPTPVPAPVEEKEKVDGTVEAQEKTNA